MLRSRRSPGQQQGRHADGSADTGGDQDHAGEPGDVRHAVHPGAEPGEASKQVHADHCLGRVADGESDRDRGIRPRQEGSDEDAQRDTGPHPEPEESEGGDGDARRWPERGSVRLDARHGEAEAGREMVQDRDRGDLQQPGRDAGRTCFHPAAIINDLNPPVDIGARAGGDPPCRTGSGCRSKGAQAQVEAAHGARRGGSAGPMSRVLPPGVAAVPRGADVTAGRRLGIHDGVAHRLSLSMGTTTRQGLPKSFRISAHGAYPR